MPRFIPLLTHFGIKGRNAEFPEGASGPLMLLLEDLEIWMSKYINGTNNSPGAST